MKTKQPLLIQKKRTKRNEKEKKAAEKKHQNQNERINLIKKS